MTGFFQSLVCKCPCRRGCTKKCQDQAKRLFFFVFLFIYFSYDFLLAIFFVVTSAFLSTGPNATIASSLGERNPGCGLSQSCISKLQRLRSPNQRGMLCTVQSYCTALWPDLCSTVKKLNIYYFAIFQYIVLWRHLKSPTCSILSHDQIEHIDSCTKNMTRVNCKFLLMKSPKKYFIFYLHFT